MSQSRKIVLLGQFGVGKTSLLERFLTDSFSENYKTTLGVAIKKKDITLPSGKTLSMIIWDLEGFSTVEKIRSSYLLGSHGFVYVFDLSRPVTYYNLKEELEYVATRYPDVVVKVIGNKLDLKNPRGVNEFLLSKGIQTDAFVSAKTGEGVHQLFMDMGSALDN